MGPIVSQGPFQVQNVSAAMPALRGPLRTVALATVLLALGLSAGCGDSLMHACDAGDAATVRELVRNGADVRCIMHVARLLECLTICGARVWDSARCS